MIGQRTTPPIKAPMAAPKSNGVKSSSGRMRKGRMRVSVRGIIGHVEEAAVSRRRRSVSSLERANQSLHAAPRRSSSIPNPSQDGGQGRPSSGQVDTLPLMRACRHSSRALNRALPTPSRITAAPKRRAGSCFLIGDVIQRTPGLHSRDLMGEIGAQHAEDALDPPAALPEWRHHQKGGEVRSSDIVLHGFLAAAGVLRPELLAGRRPPPRRRSHSASLQAEADHIPESHVRERPIPAGFPNSRTPVLATVP